MAAFAKVEPLLPANIVNKGVDLKAGAPKPPHAAASSAGPMSAFVKDESKEKDNIVDEEVPLEAVSDSALNETYADEFNNAIDNEKI